MVINTELEYVRNCILVVIGNPNICCVQKLYNYNGSIYKYRVKWYSNYWDNSANWPDYGQNIVHRLYIYSAPNNTLSTCCFIRVILSDLAKISFTALVVGSVVSVATQQEKVENWVLILIGIFVTYIFHT